MAIAADIIEVMKMPKTKSELTSISSRASRYNFTAIPTVPSHQYVASDNMLPSAVILSARLTMSHITKTKAYANAPVASALARFGIGTFENEICMTKFLSEGATTAPTPGGYKLHG